MATPRQEGEWLPQLRHVPGIGLSPELRLRPGFRLLLSALVVVRLKLAAGRLDGGRYNSGRKARARL